MTKEHFPCGHIHHHIKAYLTAIPFAQYIMPSYQEKIPRHTKRQNTQFEETKNASAPDRAEMVELSYQAFKTTMINMLTALDSMLEQMTT